MYVYKCTYRDSTHTYNSYSVIHTYLLTHLFININGNKLMGLDPIFATITKLVHS